MTRLAKAGVAMTPSKAAAVRNVSVTDLGCDARRPRVIDVREPGEFNGELGHIPGAELVPLATLDGAAEAWSKDAPLLVVCRSGARSSTGALRLVALGFRDVRNLEGGMQAYVRAGLPVERR
jgi:rhodanese-related sulfurtransferase